MSTNIERGEGVVGGQSNRHTEQSLGDMTEAPAY